MQNYVVALGVDILSIHNNKVHVKETSTDFRESGDECQFQRGIKGSDMAYSGFAIIMMAVLLLGMADSWLVRFVLGLRV